MSAPAIPVAAPGVFLPEERAAVEAAIDRVLTSGQFVGGSEIAAFEDAFGAFVGAGIDCVSVGNGFDALVLALVALDLPEGGLVLVPPNDGGFAALAAQSAGLRPVPLDVDHEGLIGLPAIRERAEPGIVAVVATHLHGLAVDLVEISAWCRARSIALVEDCCQAHGAAGTATLGDVSAFSFYPTKNLGALGDGGAVTTGDARIADRVRSLRQYGWGRRFVMTDPRGRNSRLDSLQAAVLSARLPHLGCATSRRREIVRRYRMAVPTVRFLARDDDSFVAHHAVLVDEERARLVRLLDDAGIASEVHYPVLVADMPGLAVDGAPTPRAAALRDRQLSLPCFPGMSEAQVDDVCSVLTAWMVDRG